MLVLAVDLDELGRRLAERSQRGHAAVDPGPGAALGGDRPGQDRLAGGVIVPQPRSAPRPGLPPRPARTMPGMARPPSANCRASTTRVLPAPVSPVEHSHAGPEAQGQVLDHPEVAHVQVGQHGHGSGGVPVGQEPEAEDAAEGLRLVAHDPHRALRHRQVTMSPGRGRGAPARR